MWDQRADSRIERSERLLTVYIFTGLLFLLLPGTFLGVWNLVSISGRHSLAGLSPSWLQAHGHAQIFGWIGSFILGIGFHSLPMVRRRFAIRTGWICFALWASGVLLRWVSNVYLWHWRIFLPISAAMELAAFLLFFRTVSQHKTADGEKSNLEPWIWVVIVATVGFLAALVMNTAAVLYVAFRGASPAFPAELDQRFLVLCAWGFLVPFVWGFNAKWLPI